MGERGATVPDGVTRGFERGWQRGWELLPYALAVVAAVIVLVDGGPPVALVLLAVLLVWHTWFVPLHPQWQERRLAPMAVYLAGYLALATVLSLQHRAFLVVLGGAYALSFVALPGRWAYLGVALTGICLTVCLDLRPPLDLALQLVFGTGAAGAIGWAFRQLETEARRRADVAGQLRAAAARNAELQREVLARERAAAVDAERARLARELHDTLAQDLVGITAQLGVAAELLDPVHPARARVGFAAELARAGLVEARRSVADLRPGPLASGSFLDAVGAVVAGWRERAAIAATATHSGDPVPLPPRTEDALLRTVQECLANVERHAAARAVTVTVTFLGDVVALDVRDDGRGFDPAARGGGTGRRGMAERIAAVGGTLAVESGPGCGTTVNATVPS